MEIYFVIILISFFFSIISKKYDKYTFPLSFIYLGFIGFFRSSSVGADVEVYSNNFISTTSDPSTWSQYTEFEPGFSYLIVLFKTYISNDPMLFLSFVFLVTLIGFFYFIEKVSDRPIITLFLYITLAYYVISFNAMRQSFALSLLMLFIPYLFKEKKNILFIILVIIISQLIHRVLVVLILLTLYDNKYIQSLFNKRNILISLAIAFLLFMKKDWIVSQIGYFDFINPRYLMHLRAIPEVEASPITTFSHTFFCALSVLVSYDTKNKYLFSYVLGIIFLNLLSAINTLFIRVADVFLILGLIYITHLWCNIPNIKIRYFYRFACICYVITYITNFIFKNFGFIVPYSNRLFE